jgi:lysophospholipase L1-like esterase
MENRRHLFVALTAVFSLALGCSSGNENPPNSGPQGGSSQAGSGGAGAGAGTLAGTTTPGSGGVTNVTGGSSITGGSSVTGGSSATNSAPPGTGGAVKGGTTADLGGSTAKGGTTGDLGGSTAKGGTTGDLGGSTAKGGTTGDLGGTTTKGGTTGDLGGTTTKGGTSGGMGGATGGTTGTGGKGGAGGTAAGGSGSGGAVAIPDAGPVDPNKKITFWMVGDSTMQNCSGTGQCGWASQFQQYCGPNVTVSNQARGGRSIQTWIWGDPNVSKTATDASGECQVIDTKTYSDNLTTMLDATKGMQPGDWVYVAFGINDGTAACNRHVGKALFQSDLDFMAKTIRSKGANPIFGTSTSGQSCSGSTNVANRGFGPETKAAGTADNVPVIDLLTLSVALYNSLKLCPSGSTTFWFDGTHFKTDGATQVAGVVAKAIKDQGIGLAAYLK